MRRVQPGERPELDDLIDVYLKELNGHGELPVGPRDAASYGYLPLYWKEPGRHPFFLDAGEERVGFALVREVAAENVIEMSEFYIRPGSRRTGLGKAAAAAIWRRFPGQWRLQLHPKNRAAAHFWPQCIAAFARGEVTAREIVEEDGRRVEYGFVIEPSSTGD